MLNFNNIGNPGESVAEGRDGTGSAFILNQQVPDAFNIVQRGLDKAAAIKEQQQAAHEKDLANDVNAAMSYKDAWEYDQPEIQKKSMLFKKYLIDSHIKYGNSKKESDNPELMYTQAGAKKQAMLQEIFDMVNTSKQQRFYHDEAIKKLVANPSAYDNDLENYRKMSLSDRRKYDLKNLVPERFNPDTEAGKYRKDVLPKNSTWVKNGLPVGDQQPLVQLNQYDDPQIQGLAASYLQHPGFNNFATKQIAQQDPDGKLGLTPQQIALQLAQQRGTFKGEDKFVNALSWEQKQAIEQRDKLALEKQKEAGKSDAGIGNVGATIRDILSGKAKFEDVPSVDLPTGTGFVKTLSGKSTDALNTIPVSYVNSTNKVSDTKEGTSSTQVEKVPVYPSKTTFRSDGKIEMNLTDGTKQEFNDKKQLALWYESKINAIPGASANWKKKQIQDMNQWVESQTTQKASKPSLDGALLAFKAKYNRDPKPEELVKIKARYPK